MSVPVITSAAEDISRNSDAQEIEDFKQQQDNLSEALQTLGYTESAQVVKSNVNLKKYVLSRYSLGKEYFKNGQYQKAADEFKKVLVWDPQFKPALSYIKLIEHIVVKQQKIEEKKELVQEKIKETQKKKDSIASLKAQRKKEAAIAEVERKEEAETLKFKQQVESALKKEIKDAQYNRIRQGKSRVLNEKRIKNELTEKMRREKSAEQIQEKSLKYAEVIPAKESRIDKQKNLEKLTASESAVYESPVTVEYRIDKEDILEISLWPYKMTREVVVRPDGMISLPTVGDIQAQGLTVPELKEKIIQGVKGSFEKKLKYSIVGETKERVYLIGMGDRLEILVWKSPELSRDTIVRPDGNISYPLIGDLKAEGLTLAQLNDNISGLLRKYVKDPQVSIMVKSFGFDNQNQEDTIEREKADVYVAIKKISGKKFVVMGNVTKPGVYTFTNSLRLIEALALAGDCTKYAVKNNILVIRGDIHNNPQIISCNVDAILKNAKLNENLLIQSQDIIYVPRSLIGNINTFLEIIAPIVDTVYKGATTQAVLNNN